MARDELGDTLRTKTHLVLPLDLAPDDEHAPPPHHAAAHPERFLVALLLEQPPAPAERVVVRQAPPAGDGDEAGVGRDDGEAERVLRGDVGGGYLWTSERCAKRKRVSLRSTRQIAIPQEEARRRTLMCCQTSLSGLMTLMSGWSAPR